MFLVNMSLDDFVRNVQHWCEADGLVLVYHDRRPDKAAWSAGNCLVTARAVTADTTEVQCTTFKPIVCDDGVWGDDAEARAGWDGLCRRINAWRIPVVKMGSDAVARHIMAQRPAHDRFETAAEAAAAWLGPAPAPVAAPPAPASGGEQGATPVTTTLQQGKPGAKPNKLYNTIWVDDYCPQRGGSFLRAYDRYLRETERETTRSARTAFKRAMRYRCQKRGCERCYKPAT